MVSPQQPSNSQSQSQQEQEVQQTPTTSSKKEVALDIPSVQDLLSRSQTEGGTAIRELSIQEGAEKKIEEARRIAEELQEMSIVQQGRMGFDIQQELARHQKKSIDDIDKKGIEKIKELAAEQATEMEKVRVDDLQVGWVKKTLYNWFPKLAKSWYTEVRKKFDKASDVLNEVNTHLGEELIQFDVDMERVEGQIATMEELTNKLTIIIGGYEVYYEARKQEVQAMEEALDKSEIKDRLKVDELVDRKADLKRVARRLQSLEAFKVKAMKGQITQKEMRQGYLDEIEMIQDLQTHTEMTYNTAMHDAFSADRLKTGAEIIRSVRGSNERMTEEADKMVEEAVNLHRAEFEKGVESFEKLKESSEKIANLSTSSKKFAEDMVAHYDSLREDTQALQDMLTQAALEDNDMDRLDSRPKNPNEVN